MKNFTQMLADQAGEVAQIRQAAESFIVAKLAGLRNIVGVLLTGSVARGDARIGPFGLYVDMCVVLPPAGTLDLDAVFGKNQEPWIPKHCIKLEGKVGVAIETATMAELWDIRAQPESNIFAKQESVILLDPSGELQKWRETVFAITAEDRKNRAMAHYFRFDYLVNQYRMEKWEYRQAHTQIAQNLNEALECYLNFLYCANGQFVPRKDWLAYLSYELADKPANHAGLLEKLFGAGLGQAALAARHASFLEAQSWMAAYCKTQAWL